MGRKKFRKNHKKKKILLIFIIFILILLILGSIWYYKKELDKQNKEKLILDIKEHYHEYVTTTKKQPLYVLEDEKFIKSGEINQDIELALTEKTSFNEDDIYFKIDSLDGEYYIYYKDLTGIDNLSENSNRYLNYIVYNENIITKKEVSFYDELDNYLYKLNEELDLPIIIKEEDKYGVEYNNRLLYVKKEDVKETKESQNTDKSNTTGIAVLNYHFVYDETIDTCYQEICHSKTLFKSHLDYFISDHIFTPTLKELEMYIDGKIQLPRSVVITIDDGWHSGDAAEILNEYKLNGTVFLVTSGYDKGAIESEYVEVHSHTHDMHNPGACPVGQGGGIQCLSEEYIQNDLKISREKLNNTTYFCYPFYEYNDYSIEQLKKAGFTMAFGGYHEGNKYKVEVGIDKFRLPRYVMGNNTTVSYLKKII